MSSAFEAKGRLAEEAKRLLDEQLVALRVSNQDLTYKLASERSLKDRAAAELDEAMAKVQ